MGANNSAEYEIAGELYKRLKVLGQGAYGKVYAMQHIASGEIRVIKELNKGHILATGEWAVKANVEERRLLSICGGSPYICRIYGSNQDGKNLYLMLKYCAGGELAFHLKNKGKFTESEARLYAIQLVCGVFEMHHRFNIIHRDLKPENVLLSEKGFIRIIDFNFAQQADNKDLKFAGGVCAGTMPYTAPELLRLQEYNGKVDWWSVGVMIFELMTGRTPWGINRDREKQMAAISRTTITDEIKKEVDKGVSFSPDCIDLLEKLLLINPDYRYGDTRIRKHKWFTGVDWNKVCNEDIEVPFVPRQDQVNFSADSEMMEQLGLNKRPVVVKVHEEDHFQFKGWNWFSDDQEIKSAVISESKARELEKKANKISKKRDGTVPDEVSQYTTKDDGSAWKKD